jgi:hypothetical protein
LANAGATCKKHQQKTLSEAKKKQIRKPKSDKKGSKKKQLPSRKEKPALKVLKRVNA